MSNTMPGYIGRDGKIRVHVPNPTPKKLAVHVLYALALMRGAHGVALVHLHPKWGLILS